MSLPHSALLVTVMKGLGGKEVLNLCGTTGNYAKPSSNLISNWFSLSYTLGVTWKKSLKGGMTFWGQCAVGVCQSLIEMRTMKPQLSCSVITGKVKPPVRPLTGSLSADGYLRCWAAWWQCLQKHLGEKTWNALCFKPRRSWKARCAIIRMSWTPSWFLVIEISTCKPFLDGEREAGA